MSSYIRINALWISKPQNKTNSILLWIPVLFALPLVPNRAGPSPGSFHGCLDSKGSHAAAKNLFRAQRFQGIESRRPARRRHPGGEADADGDGLG